MIKSLLIILVVEVLLFILDIFFIEKPTSRDELGEVLLIPLLFIVNLFVALLLLAFGKKETCIALLINAALSPIFFFWVLQIWDDYDQPKHYQKFHFRVGGYRYEVEFDKGSNNYNIRNNSIRNGSSSGDLDGRYTEKKGTYYLDDSGKTIVVTSDKVIGFPRSLDTVMIDTDSYYW